MIRIVIFLPTGPPPLLLRQSGMNHRQVHIRIGGLDHGLPEGRFDKHKQPPCGTIQIRQIQDFGQNLVQERLEFD